jgi:hypothetical protein
MVKYRFVTPHRIGKWYGSLREAQQYACRIGAGFLHEASQRFVAYPGTRLECAAPCRVPAEASHAALQNMICVNAKSAHHADSFARRPNPIGSAQL